MFPIILQTNTFLLLPMLGLPNRYPGVFTDVGVLHRHQLEVLRSEFLCGWSEKSQGTIMQLNWKEQPLPGSG